MRHIEVHVLETDADVSLALTSGLIELDDLDGATCSDCEESVGHADDTFYTFCVVLNEDDYWFVCEDCATPVVHSESTIPFVFEFGGFVDGIDGMLTATFDDDIDLDEL